MRRARIDAKKADQQAKKVKKPQPKKKSKLKSKNKDNPEKFQAEATAAVDDAKCTFCTELYSTSGSWWIQCTQCKLWAHTECAGMSKQDDTFTCELCQD